MTTSPPPPEGRDREESRSDPTEPLGSEDRSQRPPEATEPLPGEEGRPQSRRPEEFPGGGPQSPGPQSPGAGQAAHGASGPQSPGRSAGVETPESPGPQSPGVGSTGGLGQASGHAGPVPPGGWQQEMPAPAFGGRLASWGIRFAAYIIDGLIVGIPALIIIFALVGGLVASDDSGGGGFVALIVALVTSVLVFTAVLLLYAPLLMMRAGPRNGQTFGKQMMKIRVIRVTGEPMTFAWAALREVVLKQFAVWIASAVIPVIPFLLDYLWPLWDDENRALHDFPVNTRVVRE